MGRDQGLTEDKLRALDDYATSAALSDVEKLALQLGEAMTRTPAEIPDELFASLQSHFSDQQLVELTSSIAWENYRARFDHAFGAEAEGFSDGAYCPVPARAVHA